MKATFTEVLGLSANSTAREIEGVFENYRANLEAQIASAPTPALKSKLRKKLREAENAYEVYLAGSTEEELPSTQKADGAPESTSTERPSTAGQTRAKLPYHFQGQKLLTTEAVASAFLADWQAGFEEYTSGKLAKWIKEQVSDPHFAELLSEIEALKGLSPELDDAKQRFSLVLLLLDPSQDIIFDGAPVALGSVPDETLFSLLAVINVKKGSLELSSFPTQTKKISGNGQLQTQAQEMFQRGTDAYVPLLLASPERLHHNQFVQISLGKDQQLAANWAFASDTFQQFAQKFPSPWSIANKGEVATLALQNADASSLKQVERRAAEKLKKNYVGASKQALKSILEASQLDRADVVAIEVGSGWLTAEDTKAKEEQTARNKKLLVVALVVFAIIGGTIFVNYQREQARLKQLHIERAERTAASRAEMARIDRMIAQVNSQISEATGELKEANSGLEYCEKLKFGKFKTEAERKAALLEAGACGLIVKVNTILARAAEEELKKLRAELLTLRSSRKSLN